MLTIKTRIYTHSIKKNTTLIRRDYDIRTPFREINQ